MKKILLILCVVLTGCHFGSSQFLFNNVTSVDLMKNGKKLKTLTVNHNNESIRILNNVTVIQETGSVPRFEWDYQLRLNSPNSEPEIRIFWLYSSKTGQLIRLTKVKTPLYQIKDVENFNKLLGIKQNT